jgi:demethylmenaquinone methyltransferase/2-methoxy-6-polyprenyl-1,4-benzoquinol methylase
MGPEKKLQIEGLAGLGVSEGESVLEIGFGTGQGLAALARSVGKTGRVYGIDLSAGMLQVASSRLKRLGLAERVELRQADAVHLPYPDSSMDAVFMSFTLEIFTGSETEIVLGECRRLLRPGVRICVIAISENKPGLVLTIYKWFHRAFPSIIDCRPIKAAEKIRQAGFIDVQTILRSLWGIPAECVWAVKQLAPTS